VFVLPRAGRSVAGKRRKSAPENGGLSIFRWPQRTLLGPVPTAAAGKIQKFVLRERARVYAAKAGP